MSAWLDPVRAALDRADPIPIFFRDDDVGWCDERLLRMLEVFASAEVPIDLAVIPAAASPRLVRTLQTLPRVELHQHGYAHVNHELDGRKAEFGPSRPLDAQRRDIAAGWSRLQDLAGEAARPIFTPPWNRCTGDTGRCLAELGFCMLSREAGAAPLDVPSLCELPIQIDWFARRHGERLAPAAWSARLAAALAGAMPVGIMLHHANMDTAERAALGELLALVGNSRCARPHSMFAFRQMTSGARLQS
jgi:hypothetical protein